MSASGIEGLANTWSDRLTHTNISITKQYHDYDYDL